MTSLCEYELTRLANMERNASTLSDLDITETKKQLQALRTPARRPVQRRVVAATLSTPSRRSSRQAGKPLEYSREFIELPSQLPRKKRPAAKRAKFVAPEELTEEERAELSRKTGWLEGFGAFLRDVLEDSEQNRRQVNRQVCQPE